MSLARILLVDDEPDMLENCSRILSRQGHTCMTAANEREALAVLERERPDLLVTDLKMPEMDGMALLRHASKRQWAITMWVPGLRRGDLVAGPRGRCSGGSPTYEGRESSLAWTRLHYQGLALGRDEAVFSQGRFAILLQPIRTE